MKDKALRQFCAPDYEPRETLRDPFAYKGKTYATNGHILVRAKAEKRGYPASKKYGANCDHIIENAKKDGFVRLEELPEQTFITCSYCEGEGKAECDMGHIHECPACEGMGQKRDIVPIAVGDAYIDLKYASMIAGLDEHEIAFPADSESALYFRFQGGEGAVMPIRKDSAEGILKSRAMNQEDGG